MVECHLPSSGKEGCVARDAFSLPTPPAQYSKPLKNSGQLRKITRNQKRPRLMSLKRKQQPALATIDLIFLAPTWKCDIIWCFKTEIEIISLRCRLCSPQEMEQGRKHFGERAFIWVQMLRLHWRADKSAGKNQFCREQGPRLTHFWVQFPRDLGSCVYKLPSSQKFHCSGREEAVARGEISWVPEMFSVILWETEWFDGHRYWWELMEILLSQYYVPGIKICVSSFAHDTAGARLHRQNRGLISCCSTPWRCPHCV